MRIDPNIYGFQFDRSVTKDLSEIEEKLDREASKDNPDKDEIMKLRLQRLYRGMELNSAIGTRYNGIPW